MHCLVDLTISLEDLFGKAPMHVGAYFDSVEVKLYKCIENSLLRDLETYGLYESFDLAIDTVTKDEDDDDVVDAFIDFAKAEILADIKDHKLNVVKCCVNCYGGFDVTFDVDFEGLWKQFKGGSHG